MNDKEEKLIFSVRYVSREERFLCIGDFVFKIIFIYSCNKYFFEYIKQTIIYDGHQQYKNE